MFINLFKSLRRHGVPVTFNEWLLLQKALSENLADSSLTRFYYLARAIMVKTEAHFDKFDQAFLECFGHIESDEELLRIIEERLQQMPPLELTEEEKRMVEKLDLETLRSRFLDQLRNQDEEPHVGGNKAIGVKGRSPYGAWGYNPAGVRVGQHVSRHHSAIQIAEKRSFKNYRDDMTLDTRSIKTVLSYIRQVVREGPKDNLDVDGTIDATCRNAGELEFIWDRARKKRIKLMLLMDAGGTMTPHTELVSRLFSAAKDIVKDLKFYYFHNCIYQELYTDIGQMTAVSTRKMLDQTSRDYKVILVGDAYMAPSELMSPNGAIDYWYRNDRPGIEWLMDIRRRFRKVIWLNPEPSSWWPSVPTTRMIQKIFPMYELTLEGMRSGARALIKQ
ncbi:MAG: VWA containing CoxE family protein [Acidobacteriota bacterium]|nr:VWA containing CoxE family protein [Acidobacteriota bacterium]